MTKLEIIKWIGTLFIILSPIVAFYHYIPFNLLVLSVGTIIWGFAGVLSKDRPMIFVNLISTILNTLAYINN